MERDARIHCCSVQHDCSREGESFLASIIGPNTHRLRQPLPCLTTTATDGDGGDLRFCLPRILQCVVFDAPKPFSMESIGSARLVRVGDQLSTTPWVDRLNIVAVLDAV